MKRMGDLQRPDASATLISVTGSHLKLHRAIVEMGTESSCDLCLEGLEPHHAQWVREGQDHILVALSRKGSVAINAKKIKKATVSDGDIVDIGNHRFIYTHQSNLFGASAQHDGEEQDGEAHRNALTAYHELVGFSQQLIESEAVSVLLQNLLDRVLRYFVAEKGFVVLFKNGERNIYAARSVDGDTLQAAAEELSDAIVAKVVQSRHSVIVNGVQADNIVSTAGSLHDEASDAALNTSLSMMNLKLRSVMCAPLNYKGEILGLIYLGTTGLDHPFEQAKLEALEVFAAQAALLVSNALLVEQLRGDVASLQAQAKTQKLGNILGESESMQTVFRMVQRIAGADVPVLISGETGTGKELVAKQIHALSDRCEGPFVVVNCGAIPENLLESELFGHVCGAFTGAVKDRDGKFRAADGGTLFLDEIGEMPLPLQVKLLRVLQERVVQPVGSNETVAVDIRVLSATHRDLLAEIQEGRFREDLYYRLNVVNIHLPALRERDNDVMLLARFILESAVSDLGLEPRRFSQAATSAMRSHRWPGNIRELENRIKKAAILCEEGVIHPHDLSFESEGDGPQFLTLAQAKERWQRGYIHEVLNFVDGNRSKAAHILGVDPRTVFRHLEKEGFDTL